LQKEELHSLYSSSNTITVMEIKQRDTNLEKLKERDHLGGLGDWKNYIDMDVKDINFEILTGFNSLKCGLLGEQRGMKTRC
jgi:HPt (histidine-containing phosphotransfer) domain-containing protein